MTSPSRRPRIAYARALQQYGAEAVDALRQSMVDNEREASLQFDWSAPDLAIRETDAMAMLAVNEGKADVAIIPYIDDSGYNFAALNDMNSAFDLVATRILCTDTNYCLAAMADDIPTADPQSPPPAITELIVSREAGASIENKLAGLAAHGAAISTVDTAQSASRMLVQGNAGATPGIRAAIIPQSAASRNSRFTILKENINARPKRQWFLALQRARDETVYFDKYKTTRARARYFCRRLQQIGAANPEACGVGLILRFKRDGDAAATADIERFLRAHGVRYEVMDLPPRNLSDAPQPRIMEIEFDRADFEFGLRRLTSGAVAADAMRIAFSKWKSRGVQLIGVMPVTTFRLPARAPRRWWREGAGAGVRSFGHTMFVRFSRLLIYALAILALAGAALFVAFYL